MNKWQSEAKNRTVTLDGRMLDQSKARLAAQKLCRWRLICHSLSNQVGEPNVSGAPECMVVAGGKSCRQETPKTEIADGFLRSQFFFFFLFGMLFFHRFYSALIEGMSHRGACYPYSKIVGRLRDAADTPTILRARKARGTWMFA
jgi:hypothetical protein